MPARITPSRTSVHLVRATRGRRNSGIPLAITWKGTGGVTQGPAWWSTSRARSHSSRWQLPAADKCPWPTSLAWPCAEPPTCTPERPRQISATLSSSPMQAAPVANRCNGWTPPPTNCCSARAPTLPRPGRRPQAVGVHPRTPSRPPLSRRRPWLPSRPLQAAETPRHRQASIISPYPRPTPPRRRRPPAKPLQGRAAPTPPGAAAAAVPSAQLPIPARAVTDPTPVLPTYQFSHTATWGWWTKPFIYKGFSPLCQEVWIPGGEDVVLRATPVQRRPQTLGQVGRQLGCR